MPSISTPSSDDDSEDDGSGVDVSRIVFSNFNYEDVPAPATSPRPTAEVRSVHGIVVQESGTCAAWPGDRASAEAPGATVHMAQAPVIRPALSPRAAVARAGADSDNDEDSDGAQSPDAALPGFRSSRALPSTRPEIVSMDDVPPVPPGFGSGWLLGAAGRLADLDSPRRNLGQQVRC